MASYKQYKFKYLNRLGYLISLLIVAKMNFNLTIFSFIRRDIRVPANLVHAHCWNQKFCDLLDAKLVEKD